MQQQVMFTVSQTLLGPGDPGDRFFRCLVEARHFIDKVSIADILDYFFERRENRYQVLGSVLDSIHVGFVYPGPRLSIAEMVREANRAGFSSGHSTISSTVISRELSVLSGRPTVPTDIFTARRDQINGRSGYAEAFIPSESINISGAWIKEEVGTHVGLTMTDPLMFSSVKDAFEAEGFLIPPFMSGKPIANLQNGLVVTYFEKKYGDGTARIEVLSYLGEREK